MGEGSPLTKEEQGLVHALVLKGWNEHAALAWIEEQRMLAAYRVQKGVDDAEAQEAAERSAD